MSVATTVSRLTGFVRTWAMAYALGATLLASSYTVANNIPNMVFELVAGGILSSVFIPVFIEVRQRTSKDDAWRFASHVFNITMLVLGVVALIGTVFAEPFVRTQTFRISPEEARTATYLFRFFAVQIVFYGALAVFTGVLNSHRRFVGPAVAPIFNNIVVIVTLLGFYVPFRETNPDLAVTGLAIGTTLGVVAMAAVQIPSLARLGARWTPEIDVRDPGIRKMALLIGPTVGYVVTNLIAVSFRNAYAFAVEPGGPAILLYAWMFYQLPYGIFAVALTTALFPELSDTADRTDWATYKTTFGRGVRSLALLIIPMAAMLIALAGPLVTLYRAGELSESAVPQIAAVLTVWAVALPFYATFMFVLKAFYAMQDTRTPMIVNAVTTVLQVSLYATLTTGIAGWTGLGLIGIPVTDVIFYSLTLAALTVILRRRVGAFDFRGIAAGVLRVTAASAAGAAAAIAIRVATAPLAELRFGFLGQLLLAGVTGLAVTYGLAAALRVPEIATARAIAVRGLRKLAPRRRADD